MIQKEQSRDSFYENILFPGVSVMYTDYEEANLTVEDDSDGEKVVNPKAVF